MTDRELLELAAKAAGFKIKARAQAERDAIMDPAQASLWIVGVCTAWNPLTKDEDAFRLAVKLGTSIDFSEYVQTVFFDVDKFVQEDWHNKDPYAATRRAIVRAAAEIGRRLT